MTEKLDKGFVWRAVRTEIMRNFGDKEALIRFNEILKTMPDFETEVNVNWKNLERH